MPEETDFVGMAHRILDARMHILVERKNLRERIADFKKMLAEIAPEDFEDVRMIVLRNKVQLANLSTAFDALDAKLAGEG